MLTAFAFLCVAVGISILFYNSHYITHIIPFYNKWGLYLKHYKTVSLFPQEAMDASAAVCG